MDAVSNTVSCHKMWGSQVKAIVDTDKDDEKRTAGVSTLLRQRCCIVWCSYVTSAAYGVYIKNCMNIK